MRCAIKALRVGLILDDLQVPDWIASLIEQLAALTYLQVVPIVFGGGSRRGSLPALARWCLAVEKLCLGTIEDGKPQQRPRPIPIRLASDHSSRTATSKDVPVAELSATDLDVVVQLGNREVPATISESARYGIWNFHYKGHGTDPEHALMSLRSRGSRSYELVLRSTCSGNRRYVLYRNSFETHSVSLYKDLSLDRQRRSQILLACLSNVFHRGWDHVAVEELDSEAADILHVGPSGARFACHWLARAARELASKLWFEEHWMIALAGNSSQGASIGHSRQSRLGIMEPRPGLNCADPFLFAHEGKTYVFFEQWRSGHRGEIHCAEVGRDGTPGDARRVLARDYHLSYPFVFQWQDEIYMMPETQENRTVEVYRALEFPYRWEHAGVLLSNVTAVDSTIFEGRGKLWLFAAGIGGQVMNSSELSLFFASSLFGPWRPHPKNPIVCDVRRARPAGALFTEGGALIRPGQDCSGRYGRAITLNRIDVLSENDYRETPFATIYPDWLAGICATHTLNRTDEIQVLDAVARRPRYRRLAAA